MYEGPAETFAWKVGGGAAQAIFVGRTQDNQVWHDLAVVWPLSGCPTEEPAFYPPNFVGPWHTYPPQTTGTCLKTVLFETVNFATSTMWAKSKIVEFNDGSLDCIPDARRMGHFCLYRGYAQDASWSLDMLFPGPPDPDTILDAVPAMTSRLVTIHV